ncbi:MAG: DUF1549 domain-containing protein, partial [Planctomycetota bacterium]
MLISFLNAGGIGQTASGQTSPGRGDPRTTKTATTAILLVICLCCGHSISAADDSATPDFNGDIRPLLSNHCFACHGPDAENRAAGLRLDLGDDVDFDELLRRIVSDDPDDVMPPPETHKPLSESQIQTLRRWVDSGAKYQRFWAFTPLAAKSALDIDSSPLDGFDNHAIDRFVAAKLIAEGRQHADPADRETLIRRLSLDLTGLPPTPTEIDAFLADASQSAYENAVDRLLASPRFGEHMARYWLDLVRFSDTNGLHHDHYRDMTPYRDWVIRSFNDNMPYDQFLVDQVAGDLHPEPTQSQLIASGFNRLHLIIDVGTALPEESLHRNVVDRVTAVGTAFMGLT